MPIICGNTEKAHSPGNNFFEGLYNGVEKDFSNSPVDGPFLWEFRGKNVEKNHANYVLPRTKMAKNRQKGLKTNEIPIKKQEKTPEWAFLLVWSR